MSFVKSKGYLALPIIIFFIMFFDYFFTLPIIPDIASIIRTWALVISSMALGIGIVNLVKRHGGRIYTRKDGEWMFSAVTLITFLFVFFAGILAKNTELWNWPFVHVYTTLQQTVYASTGFYIVSSAYRAFRARNVDATLLLISGCILMLRNAPIGEVIWGGFPVIGDWLMDVGQLPAYGTFRLIAAFGLIAYGFRVILAKERGFYGGGEE